MACWFCTPYNWIVFDPRYTAKKEGESVTAHMREQGGVSIWQLTCKSKKILWNIPLEQGSVPGTPQKTALFMSLSEFPKISPWFGWFFGGFYAQKSDDWRPLPLLTPPPSSEDRYWFPEKHNIGASQIHCEKLKETYCSSCHILESFSISKNQSNNFINRFFFQKNKSKNITIKNTKITKLELYISIKRHTMMKSNSEIC